MEHRHLVSFVSVADTGSMTNAAARCNLTQSAISHHIKSLEDELGVSLFDRKKNDMLITNSGKILLKYARNILMQSDECKAEIESCNGHMCGELRIGVGSFIAPYIRKAAVMFMEKYPDVLLSVYFYNSNVLNKMLRNEEIDLAFTINTSYHNEGIMSVKCIPFTLSAIMSRRNALACKEVVTFEDLENCRFALTDADDRIFDSLRKCTSYDISKLNIQLSSSNTAELLMVVDSLDLVTLLPAEYTNTSKMLISKPIDGIDTMLWSNVHYMKNNTLKASARAFLEIVNEVVSERV